jgi:hypothetical protein
MQIQLSKNRKVNLSLSGTAVLRGFKKLSGLLVILSFLLSFIFMLIFWYRYLYAFDWTEEQKQGYRSEYAGETTFREEKFDQTIELLKKRENAHQGGPTVSKDVFFGKSL